MPAKLRMSIALSPPLNNSNIKYKIARCFQKYIIFFSKLFDHTDILTVMIKASYYICLAKLSILNNPAYKVKLKKLYLCYSDGELLL